MKNRVFSEYMKYLIFEIKFSKDLNNLSTNLFSLEKNLVD